MQAFIIRIKIFNYNNSRLHHLSVWKSEFKCYINELQKRGTDFTGRQRLREFVQQKCEGISDRGIQHVRIVGKPEKVHAPIGYWFSLFGFNTLSDARMTSSHDCYLNIWMLGYNA
jgi:hypothetical protein